LEEARRADELPHRVRLTHGFYLGAREVTVREFRRFVDETGYVLAAKRRPSAIRLCGPALLEPLAARIDVDLSAPPDSPVVNVTWDDACAFCRWLALREGRGYRLPTEAEWEYACRAGSRAAFFWGDDADRAAQWAQIMPTHWGAPADHTSVRTELFTPAGAFGDARVEDQWRPEPAAGRAPNPLGLYDMHGSVWEWCADRYDADYYRRSPSRDPQGPAEGQERVVRGGCRGMLALQCRAARRASELPDRCDCTLGFRIAADLETPSID
jgi:formylglycine-generating enzyme required for sulfatase activity